MNIQAAFLVEPFEEGQPGRHVVVAVQTVEAAGLTVDQGPFGNSTVGDAEVVIPAVARALQAALDAGATRVTVNVESS